MIFVRFFVVFCGFLCSLFLAVFCVLCVLSLLVCLPSHAVSWLLLISRGSHSIFPHCLQFLHLPSSHTSQASILSTLQQFREVTVLPSQSSFLFFAELPALALEHLAVCKVNPMDRLKNPKVHI
ncbi:hypothetical protein M011DRAFT_119233 [Sporormia fimetaria CBS 119925]|uniref:Uncharacterized protein n=1 Tax=Sporormia fimetaria CBS 119925 TaxID=1340428 RepID=A0A6A6VP94_9PLEO|nr:hypothetical protein M011DRAFT_119233 [Sporormia fimetaria CBS 119925]